MTCACRLMATAWSAPHAAYVDRVIPAAMHAAECSFGWGAGVQLSPDADSCPTPTEVACAPLNEFRVSKHTAQSQRGKQAASWSLLAEPLSDHLAARLA